MKRQIQAVYTDGGFCPVNPAEIQLDEGESVWLMVFNAEERARYVLDLTQQVYEGLSEEEIAAIEAPLQRQPPRKVDETVQPREDTDTRVERIKALIDNFYEDLPAEEIDAMERAMRRQNWSSLMPSTSKTLAAGDIAIVGQLSDYYVQQSIHPEHFNCPHQAFCRGFAHQGRMTETKMSMVGSSYGIDYPRIVVVSLDPPNGDNGVFTEARHRTTEFVSSRHEADDYTRERPNVHWAMTQIVVKDILCLFGYEAPPKAAVVEESYSGRPIDNVSRYFAHVNVAKCSMNNQGKAQAHRAVHKKCADSYLVDELTILGPDILVTQGRSANQIMRRLVDRQQITTGEPLPMVVREPWGKATLWLPMHHPARQLAEIRRNWGEYVRAIMDWK